MNRIDGKALATDIRAKVRADIATSGIAPTLAVLLVGDDPASRIYVNLKEKACTEAGIVTDIRRLPGDTSSADLVALIETWNADAHIDAILVQVPLPSGHDQDAVIAAIDPKKDVDGFHPTNEAALLAGEATLFPPVHEGILRLIGATDVVLKTSNAVIIANSETFAAPLERLLTVAGCATDIYGPADLDRAKLKDADIVVIAIGHANFLTATMVKAGVCIIDVGTNRLADGKVVGDVDAASFESVDGWLSPVPGGVGPMTVALLLKNTFELAKRRT
ncbi:bifunctional 5,10-methylenetetrahydrofolate dehydrogenase/5,10-methenyltetrahydrofolate cyclohydrolase [Patescibacteria group bacterium]|nr:bifunctional 5,10-methylenetetrahydrofolate dehydrogenase/5,10-methenyltetrahydrofolate cyclohydrolase [Patescibacteria group bacterium]MBU1448413.1 bifunctional 5,10-methylenetetrahydrofolate dehydrogenase/5,10-methenyltetrahydrofolate cyclohydrolase [Patescibacteria group bacterium]MBU2613378.1 bifunctional 5,10-methylenetetrahydrofolate dehydrogenase/5,10-methenyltetrahydrofolate cyclohydrolase [Patescibacteria group bacterium]